MELAGWGRSSSRPPRFPTVAMELRLAPKQLGVICRLEPDAPLSMGKIGERLFCDASYVTDLVDRLEAQGLIERRPDPNDRRVKLIALTPAGEEMRERAIGMLSEPPPELAQLDEDDLEQLAGLLLKATAGVPATPA